jgi:hypothetical protein
MIVGKLRIEVGTRMVTLGEHVQAVAPEFGSAWDPNAQTPLTRTTEVAGKVVSQLGYAILPELLHAYSESDK